jgi:hypothetical protein
MIPGVDGKDLQAGIKTPDQTLNEDAQGLPNSTSPTSPGNQFFLMFQ